MTCDVIEGVISKAAELAKDVKYKLEDLYHDIHIRNAKDACEDYIKKCINPNDYDCCVDDDNAKILKYYDSCDSKDQASILKHLQTRIDKFNNEIIDLKEHKRTLQYCLFKDKPSKDELIKQAEYKRNICERILQTLKQPQTLRPN